MPNAPSPAAPTAPPTTKPTTYKRGNTAALPTSATWPNSAPNTTGSNTTANGHRTRPPRMNHPAGPHQQAGTTTQNTPTPNRPSGHREACRWMLLRRPSKHQVRANTRLALATALNATTCRDSPTRQDLQTPFHWLRRHHGAGRTYRRIRCGKSSLRGCRCGLIRLSKNRQVRTWWTPASFAPRSLVG